MDDLERAEKVLRDAGIAFTRVDNTTTKGGRMRDT